MCELLLSKGVNIHHEDKRGMTPTAFAKKNYKSQIVELLMQHGGGLKDTKKQQQQKVPPKPVEEKPKVNERKVPKRYLLTTLREGGYYEPLTDAEFEQFKLENPEIAQYFLVSDDQEAKDLKPISELDVPPVNEAANIYDHWEKAAMKMLQMLGRIESAWIF